MMTVTLSKELEAEVKERMAKSGLAEPAEVIAVALRRWAGDDLVADLDPDLLESELLKGVESPHQRWEAAEFDALRARLRNDCGK